MMDEKDIQKLIAYIEEGQKRIDDAKRKLLSQTDNFDIWLKYGVDRINYPFLLGADNPIRQFLDKHCSWIYEEWRYKTIDVDWIVDALEELHYDGEITEWEVEQVKKALVKSNYGSMKIDW